MHSLAFQYLENDHNQLEAHLNKAIEDFDNIDMEAYDKFRRGLLRHISIEEKIAIPTILQLTGAAVEDAERIRSDHGGIGALLVMSPTKSIIATLRSILDIHNAMEEKEDGFYSRLDEIKGVEADELLARMHASPPVPASKYNDKPGVLDAIKRAVVRSGYEFLEVE